MIIQLAGQFFVMWVVGFGGGFLYSSFRRISENVV